MHACSVTSCSKDVPVPVPGECDACLLKYKWGDLQNPNSGHVDLLSLPPSVFDLVRFGVTASFDLATGIVEEEVKDLTDTEDTGSHQEAHKASDFTYEDNKFEFIA